MQASNAELRAIITNDALPLSERTEAADHAITIALADIEAAGIADDDPAVIARMTPWEDRKLAELAAGYGDGESLAVAKRNVLELRKRRAVLAVVVDEQAHTLERLTARRWMLAQSHPRSFWHMNNYSPERMLAEVLPATATKSTSIFKGPEPVSRPPMSALDVWRL